MQPAKHQLLLTAHQQPSDHTFFSCWPIYLSLKNVIVSLINMTFFALTPLLSTAALKILQVGFALMFQLSHFRSL